MWGYIKKALVLAQPYFCHESLGTDFLIDGPCIELFNGPELRLGGGSLGPKLHQGGGFFGP